MFDKKNIKRYYLLGLKKTRDFLLSAKSREFLVFLFFIFVSFCFWLLQTMNDVYQTEFKVPIRLRGIPKDVVLTSEIPNEIKVGVEDRGTVLLNYMLGRTFFPISFEFSDYQDVGEHVCVPSAEVTKKISAQLNTSTKLLSIRPDTIDFIYTRGKAKKIPVAMNGHVTAGRQYYISGIKFKPDSVMVYAPDDVLNSITAAYIHPVHLEDVTDTVRTQVMLQRIKGAKFVPASNELSVFVDMYSEKTVDVPIVGMGFPKGKVLRTFPSKVQVTFQIGLSHFKQVSADDFLIGVSYENLLKNKADKISLTIENAPEYASHIRINPPAVDYLIEEQLVNTEEKSSND